MEEFDDYQDENSEAWLCLCGHYIENGLHCPDCGQEPHWGCPCSQCQNPEEEDEDYFDFDDDS